MLPNVQQHHIRELESDRDIHIRWTGHEIVIGRIPTVAPGTGIALSNP